MSNKIENNLESLHWFTKQQALKVLTDAHKAGLNVHVFETLRTLSRQKYLKSIGSSSTLNSYHRLGLAVDFVFKTPSGKWTWDRPKKDWDDLAKIMVKHGFYPGWYWTKFKDGPHAQIQFQGISAIQLYKNLTELHCNLGDFYNYIDGLLEKDPVLKKMIKEEPVVISTKPHINVKVTNPSIIQDTVKIKVQTVDVGNIEAQPPKPNFLTEIMQFIFKLIGGKRGT